MKNLTSVKINNRIAYLQKLHDDLDKQIQEDHSRYKDDALVNYLKKKKLKTLDEITKSKKLLEN
jgi:hypothetical protein